MQAEITTSGANRKIHEIYCLIEENILDDEAVWTNMRQIKDLTTEFFTTAKQFKFNCMELFDFTGYEGIMQWKLSSDCYDNSDGIIDWKRPVIIEKIISGVAILSTNVPNVYFYKNPTFED